MLIQPYDHHNVDFLRTDHQMSFVKIFQRSRGCIMYLKLVQTAQGYQSLQLLSDLNSYRRRYWSIFKTAGNPPLKKLSKTWQKDKIQFLVTKSGQKWNSTCFSTTSDVIYLIIWFYFLIWTSFEGFIFKKVFFFNILCENTKKWQNAVLGYK